MNKMMVFLGERIPLGFISYLHLRGTVIASSLLRAVLGRAKRSLGRVGVVISIIIQLWNKQISWNFFCPRGGDQPVPVLAGDPHGGRHW